MFFQIEKSYETGFFRTHRKKNADSAAQKGSKLVVMSTEILAEKCSFWQWQSLDKKFTFKETVRQIALEFCMQVPKTVLEKRNWNEMGILSKYFFSKNPTIFSHSRPCIKSNSKQTDSKIIWRLMFCDQIWLPFSRKKLPLGYHIKWSDQKIKNSRIPQFASLVWLLSCCLTRAHRKSFLKYWIAETLEYPRVVWRLILASKHTNLRETCADTNKMYTKYSHKFNHSSIPTATLQKPDKFAWRKFFLQKHGHITVNHCCYCNIIYGDSAIFFSHTEIFHALPTELTKRHIRTTKDSPVTRKQKLHSQDQYKFIIWSEKLHQLNC